MTKKVLLSVLITDASQVQRLADLPPGAGLVEVQADAFDADPVTIRNSVATPLLLKLRSKIEGGFFSGTKALRIQKLTAANEHFDLIELEGERDLVSEILGVIPPGKRVISWQGKSESFECLLLRLQRYLQTPAKYYRIVIEVGKSGEEIPVIHLLKSQKRKDLIAHAVGPAGMWTQPLSAFLGAPVLTTLIEPDNKKYQYSFFQLIEDYGLPAIYPVEKIFGIVGNPVLGSISPKLHNEAYRLQKLPYLYLPFHADSLEYFFDQVVNCTFLPFPISGLTVVSPFKEASLHLAGGTKNPDVQLSKASNILLKHNCDDWAASSTDSVGVIDALNSIETGWEHKKIVIVGCGGTGRTIAAAFCRSGIKATLVNRTVTKGLEMANILRLPFVPLSDFDPSGFDVIIHATPLGKNQGEIPFDKTCLKPGSIVIDHVYALPAETELVRHCRLCNIRVFDGVEMAELQIKHQFKQMTGREMSRSMVKDQTLKLK